MARDYTCDKSNDQWFICRKIGHNGYDCTNVSIEIRDKHMANRKKDLDTKLAPKVGTQHAAMEEEEISVVLIVLEDNGMPSREEILNRLTGRATFSMSFIESLPYP